MPLMQGKTRTIPQEREPMNEQVSKESIARDAAYAAPLETLDPAQPALVESDTVPAYFERLRREDPAHYTPESEYCPYRSIAKYNDLKAVATNHQAFSSGFVTGRIT